MPRYIKRWPEKEKGHHMLMECAERWENWEDAQPTGDGEEGAGAELRARRAERRGQDWWQRGKSGKEDVPNGFHGLFQGKETEDEFQQSGKAAGILQVGTCCQRNVLQLCCSRFTASWQITALFPDPQHPLLKIHFQSLLKVSDIGSDRANSFICVTEKLCPHVFREAAWDQADGSHYWSAFIWAAYFSGSSPAWKQSLHVKSLCLLSCLHSSPSVGFVRKCFLVRAREKWIGKSKGKSLYQCSLGVVGGTIITVFGRTASPTPPFYCIVFRKVSKRSENW